MEKQKMSHTQIIALGFLLIILCGTLLLMLPAASADGRTAGPLTAFFTAVSASCVTGLVLVDTGSGWSFFGQAVILLMIQLGGLGFMTVATLFFRLIRRRASIRERAVMAESINTVYIGRIMNVTWLIFTGTLAFELAGAALLSIRFIPMFGPGKGLWFSIFHSVSAFCNAGFDLFGGEFSPFCSLTPFAGDALVTLTVSALITVGGIGFLVWDDLRRCALRFRRLQLHTKLVITVSAVLTFGGALLFFLLERGRMNSGMDTAQQLLVSLFSSVTPRTAGFNSVDTAALSPGSKLLTMLLMVVGGSSGSTAGGAKTTTVAIILLFLLSGFRKQRGAYAFGRKIPEDALKRAVVVLTTNLLLALAAALIITGVQGLDLTDVLFECLSAIGTVGMTTGVTRALSPLSRVLVAFLMYCGRVGSVSFAIALLEKRAAPPVTYPEEQITVG